MSRSFVALLLLLGAVFPAQEKPGDPNSFPRSTVPLAEGLGFADNLTLRAPKNFLHDYPARVDGGLVNAVVEIPAGACEKWEVKLDGVTEGDFERVILAAGAAFQEKLALFRNDQQLWRLA